jgi:hypothetical protein
MSEWNKTSSKTPQEGLEKLISQLDFLQSMFRRKVAEDRKLAQKLRGESEEVTGGSLD